MLGLNVVQWAVCWITHLPLPCCILSPSIQFFRHASQRSSMRSSCLYIVPGILTHSSIFLTRMPFMPVSLHYWADFSDLVLSPSVPPPPPPSQPISANIAPPSAVFPHGQEICNILCRSLGRSCWHGAARGACSLSNSSVCTVLPWT